MKYRAALILTSAITLFSMLTCAQVFAKNARSTQQFGSILMIADEFAYFKNENKVVALGDVDFKGSNKATGVNYTARAKKITVILGKVAAAKNGNAALGAIKSADFTGPVKMTYDMPKAITDDTTGNTSKITTNTIIKANDANYNGKENMVYFTGNVVITYNDPSMMDEPSVATGEKASVNLNPNPAVDDFAYKIETPGGVSRIEVTPKSEALKKK